MAKIYLPPSQMAAKFANSQLPTAARLGYDFRLMEPGCASQSSTKVHIPRSGTLWRWGRTEVDRIACLSTDVVVRGQQMDSTIFIKRTVMSGFCLNDDLLFVELNLVLLCS